MESKVGSSEKIMMKKIFTLLKLFELCMCVCVCRRVQRRECATRNGISHFEMNISVQQHILERKKKIETSHRSRCACARAWCRTNFSNILRRTQKKMELHMSTKCAFPFSLALWSGRLFSVFSCSNRNRHTLYLSHTHKHEDTHNAF